MPLEHNDLREMKKCRDIEGLLGILEADDIKECREAIIMLGELKTKKAIASLLGLLETDDVQIRSNAAWALGEIGYVKSVLPLIGLLNDPIENVRINAAWSLGRIGDKRALSALRAAAKNGSAEMRKHAKEAMARIEKNGNDKGFETDDENESDNSEIMEVPLITLEVPSDMDCNYISRVEDESSQTDYVNTAMFSRDILIKDTRNSNRFSIDDTRKILLGVKNESRGLVSVDILFKYKNNTGDKQTSSVWLQMSMAHENGFVHVAEDVHEEIKRRKTDACRVKTRIKYTKKQRPVEYDLPEEEADLDLEETEYDEPAYTEEYTEEKIVRKKNKEKLPSEKRSPGRKTRERKESRSVEAEENIEANEPEEVSNVSMQPEPEIRAIKEPEIKNIVDHAGISSGIPEKAVQEIIPGKTEIKSARPVEPVVSQQKAPEVIPEPPKEQIKSEVKPPMKPELEPQKISQPAKVMNTEPSGNVDSAVRLLSDIGMSGMTNAASTVTQLAGEEAESLHAQLRTLPIDELHDEITGLGENVVMIGVELHGKGAAGEVNGEMQMYISKQDGLDVANELLCNTPENAIKEFNEDITSTLKETANIFGGQYVSAISEYIEVPLLLKAPSFKMGPSSQIADSILKDIAGKVEFALATNLSLGNNRNGRLIMLVDPKSFDTIIQKLFG